MILFIDHEAECLIAVENQPAAGAFGRVFPANEMPLDRMVLSRLDRLSIVSEKALSSLAILR